jgi:hypothetical protein
MPLKRGDHICCLNSTTEEVIREVARFLGEGLRNRERSFYEALLQSLFASCRAVGFCVSDRKRMPLEVLNGALLTHPIAGTHGHYSANQFYDPTTIRPASIGPSDVLGKLARLGRSSPLP